MFTSFFTNLYEKDIYSSKKIAEVWLKLRIFANGIEQNNNLYEKNC